MNKSVNPYEEVYVLTNGVRLHVVLAGDPLGKPLILLHGFPEFWYGWRHQIPALDAAGFRLIIPDQRGYNLSDKPEGIRAYNLDNLVEDVLGLADHFGYDRLDLVGHDWGAVVAWEAAITVPQRIQRLAILNVPHPAVMSAYLAKSPAHMLKSWYIVSFQIPGLADRLLRMRDWAALEGLLAGSGKSRTFDSRELVEYRKAWSQPGALTAMINWYRALVCYRPATPKDPRVHQPVLILWGKRDIALSYAMVSPSMDLCDQGRLTVFDEATHWVQHDEPSQVNRELIQFFRASDRSGSGEDDSSR